MQKFLISFTMLAMLGFGFSQLTVEAGGACQSLCRYVYQADVLECGWLEGQAHQECMIQASHNYMACEAECPANELPF